MVINRTPVSQALLAAVAIAVFVAAQQTVARGALLAYEGFDYPTGNVGGLHGGSGWTTSWSAFGPNQQVVGGDLHYLDSLGNELRSSGNHAFITGDDNGGQMQRQFPLRGETGTTTWCSFIGQRLSPHATAYENLVKFAHVEFYDTSPFAFYQGLSIGKTSTYAGNLQGTWSLYADRLVPQYSAVSQLEMAFLVLRVDHLNGADNAWLWINPDLSSEPRPESANASAVGILNVQFGGIRPYAGGTSSTGPYAEIAVDEFRVGTSFQDVAPMVPEPTSSLLSGVGILMGVMHARRAPLPRRG